MLQKIISFGIYIKAVKYASCEISTKVLIAQIMMVLLVLLVVG